MKIIIFFHFRFLKNKKKYIDIAVEILEVLYFLIFTFDEQHLFLIFQVNILLWEST